MIKHFPWKRKPWRLEWRDPVSGKTRVRSFVTEDEARTFERVQAELAQKEKELLARARRRARSNIPSYTVDEVLTAYLSRPDIRPNTAQANKYHARELRRLMGSRKMASLTPDDVKAFMQAQRMRGLQQSTANRRAGILRAACNWAVRENMLASARSAVQAHFSPNDSGTGQALCGSAASHSEDHPSGLVHRRTGGSL